MEEGSPPFRRAGRQYFAADCVFCIYGVAERIAAQACSSGGKTSLPPPHRARKGKREETAERPAGGASQVEAAGIASAAERRRRDSGGFLRYLGCGQLLFASRLRVADRLAVSGVAARFDARWAFASDDHGDQGIRRLRTWRLSAGRRQGDAVPEDVRG